MKLAIVQTRLVGVLKRIFVCTDSQASESAQELAVVPEGQESRRPVFST